MTDLRPSETRLMDLLVRHPGWSRKRLAHELQLSVKTIDMHLGRVFQVYGVATKTEAYVEHKRRHPELEVTA